jgi:hypothetical protein
MANSRKSSGFRDPAGIVRRDLAVLFLHLLLVPDCPVSRLLLHFVTLAGAQPCQQIDW